MKANPDKCHFICNADDKVNLTVRNQEVFNSPCEKLLGVRVVSKLIFGAHTDSICKKVVLKLSTLARIAPYMDFNKKRLILKLTSHGILHYLWSADLSKNFNFIVSVFIFSQYFFQQILPGGQVWGYITIH